MVTSLGTNAVVVTRNNCINLLNLSWIKKMSFFEEYWVFNRGPLLISLTLLSRHVRLSLNSLRISSRSFTWRSASSAAVRQAPPPGHAFPVIGRRPIIFKVLTSALMKLIFRIRRIFNILTPALMKLIFRICRGKIYKTFIFVVYCSCYKNASPLRKHAYSNILKFTPPTAGSFQIKILICFIFLLKT